MRIALAQIDPTVGDVQGNAARIAERLEEARKAGAAVMATPELAVCGYPPEDLLFHRGFRRRVEESMARLADAARGIDLLIGYPEYADGAIYNAAAWLRDGRRIANYRKQRLPNYQVFDDKRYFKPGDAFVAVELEGVRVAPIICEDVWHADVVAGACRAGADLVLSINASPFQQGKQAERESNLAARARENGVPLAYLNHVGGQDEVVYDGCSFARRRERTRGAPGAGLRGVADDASTSSRPKRASTLRRRASRRCPTAEESVWRALVLGVRDYVDKHRFPGVVIGLSGGVDSALVLAIACDALGAVARARRHDAVALHVAACRERTRPRWRARSACAIDVIPIEGMYQATLATLEREFARPCARCDRGEHPGALPRHAADGDLEQDRAHGADDGQQERDGGRLRDALRRHGGRVRADQGLQQDAGLAPRALAQRPGAAPVIPQRIIDRPPTAELRADQLDSDSLPPYEVLDPILEAFIEDDRSVDEIVAHGLRAPDRHARARAGEAQRVQAPAGTAGRAGERSRLRARLALSDHVGVQARGVVRPVSRTATTSFRASRASRPGS